MKAKILLCASLACVSGASATDAPARAWTPDRWFVQGGWSGDSQTTTVGAAWTWSWRKTWSSGLLTGYWEGSFGRWSSDTGDGRRSKAWVTQFGVTPVLRWTPSDGAWYVEAGIGANLLLPVYRTRDKRFSTTFNFGDHLAAGYRFGDAADQELALRVQHYSNAGIRRPNPGEDFLQLRYSRRF